MGSKERQQFDRAIKSTESSAVAREVRFRTVDPVQENPLRFLCCCCSDETTWSSGFHFSANSENPRPLFVGHVTVPKRVIRCTCCRVPLESVLRP